MTIRLKSAHYLYLGFFISIIFLLIYSNPCHSEPSDKEQWVNLYNLTGIEEPEIMDVSFHGDIACIQDTDSSTAELWDIKNEKLIKRLYLRGVLSDIEFSPNGSLIAIGRGPGFESIGLVIYWSSNGTEIPGTHVHIQNYTDDLDWTSDGKRIALGTEKARYI